MENQEEKYIVCVDRAGIGNRLKGLISAIRLSEIMGRKLLLYWENNQYCGCNFNDLFENRFEEITKKELKEIKKKNSRVYRDVLEEDYNQYDYLIFDTWKFLFLPEEISEKFSKVYPSKEGRNIDFEFERIPLEIRGALLSKLLELKPNKEILDDVDNFNKKYSLKDYVGLQIRRGDNRFTVDGREKISSDEKFIEIIKSKPNEKFFVSTDGPEIEKKIKELFGERIISYPKESLKRSQKEAIKGALIDMLILSKTKYIYGSYLSTFFELGWWFGGCKAGIRVVGIEDVKEKANPITFYEKVWRKIKFYKVNFQRWFFGSYK